MTETQIKCGELGSCIECTKRSPTFNKLADEDLKELNQNRYEVAYKKGEILFKQGSAMSHLLSLTSGYVAIILESGDLKRQIIKICRPFDLVGGLGLFLDKRHHYTAMAINDVRVCFLEREHFLNVFHRNPILSDNYMRQITKETQLLYSTSCQCVE